MRAEQPRPAGAASATARAVRPLLAALAALLLAAGPRTPPAAAAPAPAEAGAARAPAVGGAAGGDGYVFGVFPYLPPLSLDRVFAPIVGAISGEVGRTVHLRTKPSFEAYAGELSTGGYDLAFMHPFLYVNTAAGYGYVPLVQVDEPLRVVFLAPAGAGLRSLPDLAGRTLALPGPLSAVSEMAHSALAELGMRPGADLQVQHHQTKMACVQAVILRAAAACALPSFALAQMELGARHDLRAFDERSLTVGLVVAAGPRVPAAERRRLAAAMVAWSATPEGGAIMRAQGWSGFAPAVDHDFDPLRAMAARSHRLALQR